MTYVNPQFLIEPNELNEKLARQEAALRVYDTAVFLTPQANGGYLVESGHAAYTKAHIPGAGFIDLVDAWAAPSDTFNFTLPNADVLAAAIGASGIDTDSEVVLYSSGHLMWATRAWWLLRHAGFTTARILNGNFSGWRQAGLPVEAGANAYPTREYKGQSTDAFADTAQVEAGMHGKVCTVNALTQSLYEGTGDFYYQRRGHIPGSLLLYYDAVLDNERFLPAEALGKTLEEQGMLSAPEVITYCGGGIAATLDAFACVLMGQENVRVYDGSMSEWVSDPDRPLTEGPNP